MGRPVTDRGCPNAQCDLHGKARKGNIVLHGFLRPKRLTFRDIFTAVAGFVSSVVALIGVRCPRQELVMRLARAL